MEAEPARYLRPYLNKIGEDGPGFSALLWSNPASQASRFDALQRLCIFAGKSILDIGCGRADFLDYLLARGIEPNHYVGIEAIEEFAQAAERKQHRHCTILRSDFVREPARLFVGADMVICCGSLNTLSPEEFYTTLRRAFDASAEGLAFNFLASPELAAAEYLHWHKPADVRAFLRTLSPQCGELADYRDGDCTMAVWK